jgi:serine/threonine protein kinase
VKSLVTKQMWNRVFKLNERKLELPRAASQDVSYKGEIRYKIIKTLGEGGMGSVFLAEQVELRRKVALKVLKRVYAGDDEFIRRFRREAQLAASLNHRNIVTIYDSGQSDDGRLFIAMEYLDGYKLSDVLEKAGHLDIKRIVRLGLQMAEGLAAAHRLNVIHRDIKPDNIMVVGTNGSEEIKIMDFGIARPQDSSETMNVTRAGYIVGTPAYMAPEQIEEGEVSRKTDLYSFGIVLYEMLSGSHLFKGSSPSAVISNRIKNDPVPIREKRADVPVSIERILMQLLEKDPERRHRSADELVRQLVDAAQELESSSGRDQRSVLSSDPSDSSTSGVDIESQIPLSSGESTFAPTMVASPTVLAKPEDSASAMDKISPTVVGTEVMIDSRSGVANATRVSFRKSPTLLLTGVVITAVAAAVFVYMVYLRPPELVSLTIVPPEKTQFVGAERITLTVNGKFSDGEVKPVMEGTKWRSSNPVVAQVDDLGRVETRNDGTAAILALYGDRVSLPVTLTVKTPPKAPPIPTLPAAAALKSLIIRAPKRQLKVNEQVLLELTGQYDDGSASGIANAQWKSSDTTAAIVDTRGRVTGRSPGKANITANYQGLVATVPLSIQQPTPPPVPTPSDKPPEVLSQPLPAKPDLTRADALYQDGKYRESINEIDRILRAFPKNFAALSLRERVLRACKREGNCG